MHIFVNHAVHYFIDIEQIRNNISIKTSVIIPYHFLLVIYRIQTSRDTSCIYYRVYIYTKFKSWRQQPFYINYS